MVEQREALPDKQSETEFSVCTEHCSSDPAVADSRCNTIKLEPTWTREYLYSQQVEDPSLKVIIQFKEASAARPSWKDMSSYDSTVKALWAQWTQLIFRDRVLCRGWEEESGTRTMYQIILPRILQETALEAHHNHTTASDRVNKTPGEIGAQYYWLGLTSEVKKWVSICHDCSAKKSWGKRRRSQLQQYVVGAPMEHRAMDIPGSLPLTPRGNKFVLVVTDYFIKCKHECCAA